MLQLNDNRIKRIRSTIGNLRKLRALLLHNNELRALPTELRHLKEMQEFSLEWFSYLKSPMNKILKDDRGQAMIREF